MRKLSLILLLILMLSACREQRLERIATPTNLRYEDMILFDAVPGADAYVLDINDELVTITETSYAVTVPGNYTVRVKAQKEGYRDSLYTDTITFTVSYLFKDFSFNYSIHSTIDVPVGSIAEADEIAQITLSGNPIPVGAYSLLNRNLILKSSYLVTLPLGEQVLAVSTNNGSFEISVRIIDTDKPYMMSKSEIFTDFTTDVTVIYDLFGGSVTGLSGNDITSSDYTISGQTVTISKSFIQEKFDADPSRETLILGYTLESGNNVVIGYIFIKKQTTTPTN